MRFRVLGPVDVVADDGRVELRGTKLRTVLAGLLLARGNAISDSTLEEVLWGEAPPSTAQAQIHTYASRLRALLVGHGRVERQHATYRLDIQHGSLDLADFQRLSAEGRATLREGRTEEAAEALAAALALWRGPALGGVTDYLAELHVPGLTDDRLSVLEDRIEADLALGRHMSLVAELDSFTASHPLRERPWKHLMVALYRCGRRADALSTYRACREVFVEELGIDPSEEIEELHRSILAGRSLSVVAPVIPHQRMPLPPPAVLLPEPADFVGRGRESVVAANLLTSAQPDGGWTPVCAIMGMAGVGKSALALRVARQLRGSFPDGQIGVNLGELEAADTDPQPALRELLTALGVEERALPRGVRDLTRLYQRRLLGRRLLILLDDVATEQQLRPLLPVADGCRVLVTTRNRLATMEGAHRIELGVLTAAESVELLARIVGPARVQREADAAARIAEACGGLPLAVRIAGARLITRPRWPLARLADRLADPQLVLDELRVADLDVAVSILRGYEQLSPDTRCALRVQSLLGSPSFTGSSAARALNRSVWAARELLDDLVSAHLLEIDDGSADHYRFHPLVRILLREQAWADETTLEYQQLSGLATGRNGSTYQVQVA